MDSKWHLAEFNVAKMLGETDDPVMAEFMAGLVPVNAQGDESPGFVWRHQTEEGDATAIRMFSDPLIVVNFTVWESLEALRAFTYGNADHKSFLQRRRQWFTPAEGLPILTMWWIPAGHIPTLSEAHERAVCLEANGPSARAFNFRDHFPAPDEGS